MNTMWLVPCDLAIEVVLLCLMSGDLWYLRMVNVKDRDYSGVQNYLKFNRTTLDDIQGSN